MTVTDMMTLPDGSEVESLESFRARARLWLKENVPAVGRMSFFGSASDEEELADVQRNRDLQRNLFEGGLAGIVVPRAYGGQGLTLAHVHVLNQEMAGYAFPFRIQVPTFTPCMAVLLEFGTEEQKLRHVPAMLRGEELWMQFLSEPGGGSDVAGAQTTAVRDGDEWVLNGSKIWTTGAWWSDWGLCLARTNWDVPKHRGLSVFILPIHQPGIEVHRIEMLNGSKEFCQEFITDVRVPDSDRIGDVDDGWTVGTRWMHHERSFHSSPYTIRPVEENGGVQTMYGGLIQLAREAGRLRDPIARNLIGEAHALQLAVGALAQRIPKAMMAGKLNEQGASVARLMMGRFSTRMSTIRWELAGTAAGAWDADSALGQVGTGYLLRQSGEIAGGTTEMARNVVSERVLGMPRERSQDKDVAFRDIPRGPS